MRLNQGFLQIARWAYHRARKGIEAGEGDYRIDKPWFYTSSEARISSHSAESRLLFLSKRLEDTVTPLLDFAFS